MSIPISYSSQERLSYFKEKHDAYKSLISRIAEQLRPEDMPSLFWYTDAPPDLRGCSALEVLEHLQRLGKFSEKTTVQYLSQLMKDIKRIDLMKEVDSYSHNYGKFKLSNLVEMAKVLIMVGGALVLQH